MLLDNISAHKLSLLKGFHFLFPPHYPPPLPPSLILHSLLPLPLYLNILPKDLFILQSKQGYTYLLLGFEGDNARDWPKDLLLHEFTVIQHICDHSWTHEIPLHG